MSAAKRKSFLNEKNPALDFISDESIAAVDGKPLQEEEQPVKQETVEKPKPRRNRERPERKSKRVQLLIKPSAHDKIKAIADREGISVNEAINEAIEDYILKEG